MIRFERFSGMAPSVDPHKLGDTIAVHAKDCRFDEGVLSPINAPQSKVLSGLNVPAPSSRSLYKYNDAFVFSDLPRTYLDSPVPTDVWDRLYFIEPGSEPRYYAEGGVTTSYTLGLPRPDLPSTNIIDRGDSSDYLAKHRRSYVVALVDDYGHLGPTSLPLSMEGFFYDGANVTLTFPSVPTGDYKLGGNSKWRIYRSNFGSTGEGVFQYLADVPIGQTSYSDVSNSSELQEAAVSQNWTAPPADLDGLVSMPGGFFAGFVGNTLYFSEPYLPHAWPTQYSYPEKIVALGVTTVGLVVLTESTPYMMVGTTPTSLARVEIESDQSCVSSDSVVNMGGYLIFASPDGLCVAEGNSVAVVTEGLINRDDWNLQYSPTTLKAFNHEGRYVTNRFIFDPRGGLNAFVESALDFYGAYRNDVKDEVYYLDGSGDVIEYSPISSVLFKAGGYDYLTRVEEYGVPVNMGAIRVSLVDSLGDVEMTLFADGEVVASAVLSESGSFKLPKGYKARFWQVQLKGTAGVRGIYLKNSFHGDA